LIERIPEDLRICDIAPRRSRKRARRAPRGKESIHNVGVLTRPMAELAPSPSHKLHAERRKSHLLGRDLPSAFRGAQIAWNAQDKSLHPLVLPMRGPVNKKLVGERGDLAFDNRFVALAGRGIDAGPINPVGSDIHAKLLLPGPTVQVGIIDFVVVVKDIATDLLEVLVAEPIQIDQRFGNTGFDRAWPAGIRGFLFLFWSSHLGIFNSYATVLPALVYDAAGTVLGAVLAATAHVAPPHVGITNDLTS
jgi:hypothetical protein